MTNADLVFRNGSIWGAVPAGDTAIAVAGGRIVAIGRAAENATAAEVVDLAGGTLVPGFGDGHAHPLVGGMQDNYAAVAEQASVDSIVAAVADWAARHPGEPWIRGDGYDPTLAPGGIFDATWLDRAVPDRPVILRASDLHTAWANSKALKLAGISAGTRQPVDGEIVLRPDGTASGTLREWGAWGPVLSLAPAPSTAERAAAAVRGVERLASAGVTWIQDAWVIPDDVDAWLAAADLGLAARVNLALLAEPGRWRGLLDSLAEIVGRVDEFGNQLSARTVKFFADGVIESGTAALLEPYADSPHTHGMPNWDRAELSEAVAAVDRLGFQAHVHAIGDAGVRNALDAIEFAQRQNGSRDRRTVIAHAQLIDPADLPRFAQLEVIANFEPLWARTDALMEQLTVPRIGEDRAALQYPMATLLRSGAHVSFGSDWPVSSYRPLEGLAVAVTREMPDGAPAGGWVPRERLTLAEAVDAYTKGVAYQAFEEHDWGRVAVGMRADLVHLAVDPGSVSPHELPDIPLLATWLAGRPSHRAS